MRIATWNVERLKHKAALDEIKQACIDINADILVLTETDTQICLPYRYSFHTKPLADDMYKPTERRVSIFSNYACVAAHETFDDATAICMELNTERGNLFVYGTIIGVLGNRNPSFKTDLLKQIEDFRRLSSEDGALCICGDFNCSFADNYYFTTEGRQLLLDSISENHIWLTTASVQQCVDHIAISDCFMTPDAHIAEWNTDKRLSDHKGIVIDF